MESTIEELMLPAVTEIVDQVLDRYPDYPYKKAFTNPDLRRTLLVRVMNQLQNWHPGNEPSKDSLNTSINWQPSEENKIHIITLIRQEIAYIIQQKAECISRTSNDEIESCFTPSHWFG